MKDVKALLVILSGIFWHNDATKNEAGFYQLNYLQELSLLQDKIC